MRLLSHSVSFCLAFAVAACSAGTGDIANRGTSSSSSGGSGGFGAGSSFGAGTSTGGSGDFLPSGGSGAVIGNGGAGDECAGVTNEAEKQAGGKADIIFVLDNSGSMLEEAMAVQTNMNRFSQLIAAAQIDAHVIVVSSGPPTPCDPNDLVGCIAGLVGAFTGANGVCVEPPLGMAGACPDGDDTNLAAGYMHWRQEVDSHNALAQIESTFSGWQSMLRPDAATTFVVVTDDEAAASPSAAEFTSWVNSQTVFSSSIWRFSGVFCVTNGSNCANVGATYSELVNQTGGIAGDMGNFAAGIDQEFSAVFDSLATAVIADAVPVECEWVIPVPPDGQQLDPSKVNVKFTGGDGNTQTVYGVGTAGDCPPASQSLAWHYDDASAPKTVVACPDTCPVLQSDDAARIDVQFGCATEAPPIR